jgi:beta-lactamase class A
MRSTLIILTFVSVLACSRPAITESNTLENFSVTEETQSDADLALEMQFSEIAKEAKGNVGVAAIEIETGRSASLNASEHFAMQSVVKLPISMAVLRQYGDKKLNLDSLVTISKDEFVPSNMRSPLRDSKTTEITVRELIRYAVSESDGTAADVLQRVAGGAKGVQEFVDSLGIEAMKVKYSHKEFGKDWPLQYENWTTPEAAASLLRKLWYSNAESGKEVRSERPSNTGTEAKLLLQFMTDSSNPDNRIKGLLPKDAVVAHKTGTGGTKDGVTSATNDVGIITMPNGNHVAIAVFVGDSSADEKTRAGVIAKITKAVWDRWGASQVSK